MHGSEPDEVHFHEVGALDAIADVVGVAAGFAHLAAQGTAASSSRPSASATGTPPRPTARLPVPVPAVVALLRGLPSYAGPPGAAPAELCTPDRGGAARRAGRRLGPAAGDGHHGGRRGRRRPRPGRPRQRPAAAGRRPGRRARTGPGTDPGQEPAAWLLEANVDDLDPRVWPSVIAGLLEAGASDAWLTPILMKKGRPAHTLSVLARPDAVPAVRARVFRETTTIGLREQPVGKTALDREEAAVEVGGHRVSVKLARHDGVLVNAQPEHDDVARAAAALGLPVKVVLARAVAAARELLP